MSSQSDEENEVHPLVSNLLEQKFIPRTGHGFRYDRDEMIRLSTVPLSLQRPENLSVEFNGEDGKFSPYKWLEHRWEVEGIKNRAPTKKLQDALNAGWCFVYILCIIQVISSVILRPINILRN
ncbi:hypothetical protein ANCCAN_05204 [Ancylostoma caninum]|uniref:Uncharacterized protein n=1 Tax=Ancylostoma caninum TaxID=29170 RepID=A0A368GWL1_ANCCA|nr:hypothetical protein ANCCAN_05204 [Ancylostoma caninum]